MVINKSIKSILTFLLIIAVSLILGNDHISLIVRIVISILLYIFIVILSMFVDKLLMKHLNNKYNNCELKKYNDAIKKMLSHKQNKSNWFILNLFSSSCYLYCGELNKAKEILSAINPNENNLELSNYEKISFYSQVAVYHIKLKEYEKAEVMKNKMYDIIQNTSIRSEVLREQLVHSYRSIDFELKLRQGNKDILEEAEIYFSGKFKKNDALIVKNILAEKLVLVYEMMGNNDKAKEYAKFLIENHKDYYVDPKIISKYQ